MGSELLTTGSVIAAFLAGGVALFAPCCIVFLAPSYLAAAVKSRRWRLLPLTFVFAAGLALVMLPLTLGASVLAGAIAKYHQPLYIAGGLLMIALGVFALSGRMWSLPSFVRAPDTARADTGSFFALGVFSGIASACCAPVLVGVMTLSALSANPAGGFVLGVAYVFGMVFPLFVMALLWDKARLNERQFLRARPVRLRVAGRVIATNTVNLVVAVGFFAMGIAIIGLANQSDMSRGTAAQSWASERLTDAFLRIQDWAAPVPEVVQALLLFLVVGGLVAATLTGRRRGVVAVPPDVDDPAPRPDARLAEAQPEAVEGHPSHTDADATPSCHQHPAARTH
ncbi:cytochrome c biogenesis CcdA family protein [Cellulomonas gilvus]|uniref:Cytochrome c biogenesis protein transmembrane region n=1 Tax=Cellulomonas gilvus (strain ATCC 13127 / NRRL B-14078) TaxID=593907 RepID=F8A2V1_CELGA|nr:cytochrome c biogenesis CcdA family protein [Cellulomonas gilvus]AEI10668.1 cytochrome c biogenesis protein transmembrane region [Cellulomonas gilvus ATCC 13127]